jgi:hypothetical protein
MRFSDMMGSGPEQTSDPSESDPDGTVANALAPYLDGGPPAPPVEDTAPPVVDAPPPAAAVAVVTEVVGEAVPVVAGPAAPIEPDAPTEPAAPMVGAMHPAAVTIATATSDAPVEYTAIADLTPLSDDLLPRRR